MQAEGEHLIRKTVMYQGAKRDTASPTNDGSPDDQYILLKNIISGTEYEKNAEAKDRRNNHADGRSP